MKLSPWKFGSLAVLSSVVAAGCANRPRFDPMALSSPATTSANIQPEHRQTIEPAAFPRELDPSELTTEPSIDNESPQAELLPQAVAVSTTEPLTLGEVIESTYRSYPLFESALYLREVAAGNHLSAHGAFDLKLKGASENGPVGFYETYRQSVGLVQPLYSGSEIWGGYRIGRGQFQPWYLERQTNDAGEFKAGISVPLLRNRTIDERRADLWKTDLDRQLAEFDIQAQLIGFAQEASYAYWDWVAAGRGHAIASHILELAISRTDRIKRQVETGLLDPPELTDNLRLVADRRAKLADANRKLQQKAAKLSLYLRDAQGQPVVPAAERLPAFPEPQLIDPDQLGADVRTALASRPDLRLIDTLRQQFEVDLQQAQNLLQPELNAVMWGAQDVGAPASAKRDKSPLDLEAGLYLDVPVQRRKALGKITAVEAKLQQIAAKRRMTQDKISVEVQMAYAALAASFKQVEQTRESVKLAEEMADRERTNFEAGASDLLKVTLREQYAAETAIKEMEAFLEYHQARADYQAALAAEIAQ
jgi:outer membrane protein TolC